MLKMLRSTSHIQSGMCHRIFKQYIVHSNMSTIANIEPKGITNTSARLYSSSSVLLKKKKIAVVSDEFIVNLKSQDFDICLSSFRKEIEPLDRERITNDHFAHILGVLNVCCKAEHIPTAMELIAYLNSSFPSFKMNEQCYAVLLRCHGNAGNMEKVFELLNEMTSNNIAVKFRLLMPALDMACKVNDFDSAVKILSNYTKDPIASDKGVILVTMMLKMVGRNPHFLRDPEKKRFLDELMLDSKYSYSGFASQDMLSVVAATNHETVEDVVARGILVEKVSNIHGEVTDTSRLAVDGSVTAVATTYINPCNFFDGKFPSNNKLNSADLPLGQNVTSKTTSSPQKYVVSSELQAIHYRQHPLKPVPLSNSLRGSSSSSSSSGSGASSNSSSSVSANVYHHPVRRASLVEISTDCHCPNCRGVLPPLQLTADEKDQICAGLLETEKTLSSNRSISELQVRSGDFLCIFVLCYWLAGSKFVYSSC